MLGLEGGGSYGCSSMKKGSAGLLPHAMYSTCEKWLVYCHSMSTMFSHLHCICSTMADERRKWQPATMLCTRSSECAGSFSYCAGAVKSTKLLLEVFNTMCWLQS